MFVVENRRKFGCGFITRFWSSSVSWPDASRMRWMTNITSGRPASYSSNTSAIGRCSAQGRIPSRNSVTCLPSFSTIASLPTRSMRDDVAVEVDADQRPVEARGDLLDVRRLAGAVIALDHHAAIVLEARQDRPRGLRIEAVGRVEIRHIGRLLGERRHLPVEVDPEGLPSRPALSWARARSGRQKRQSRPWEEFSPILACI